MSTSLTNQIASSLKELQKTFMLIMWSKVKAMWTTQSLVEKEI